MASIIQAALWMTDGMRVHRSRGHLDGWCTYLDSGERKQTGTTTPNTRTPNEFPSDNMDDGLPF